MKTIGVLGGIGPQATMDFEARIHRVSQRLVPQHANEGYPPLVTVYMRYPPVNVDADGRPVSPLQLRPELLEDARKLGAWVDVIAIPSNTPHLFLDEIRAAAGCELVGIVDVTVEALRARHAKRVGLLGLRIPQIYAERLPAEGMEAIPASEPARDALDRAILRLMEGVENDDGRAAARRAVDEVRASGAEVTVLGCTEIPLLLGDDAGAPDLIDPAQLLAEAVVRFAVDGRES